MSREKGPNKSKYVYIGEVFKASWHQGLHFVSYTEKAAQPEKLYAKAWQWITSFFYDPPSEFTAKHWIAKRFTPKTGAEQNGQKVKSQQQVEQENQNRYNHFLADQLLDSYLSRLCHSCIPYAPKGKLVDNGHYVSRLYPFDHSHGTKGTAEQSAAQIQVKGYDLHHVFKAGQGRVNLPLQGIVKALVFNMIVENWDNKLSNYAAYPAGKGGGYKVAPFDFPFSLQRHESHAKQWNEDDFTSVINGTHPGSPAKNVAAALAETIGELGTRTSAHYGQETTAKYPAYFQQVKDQVTQAIGAELDAINPHDHSQALIRVFKEMMETMASNKYAAYQKVSQDIDDKLTLDSRYLWIKNAVPEYHERLGDNLEKFGEFVSAWEDKQARPALYRQAAPIQFAGRVREASARSAAPEFAIRIDGERHLAQGASSFHRQ